MKEKWLLQQYTTVTGSVSADEQQKHPKFRPNHLWECPKLYMHFTYIYAPPKFISAIPKVYFCTSIIA